MRVLLSIRPEYAEKIFNGSKRFEFRRSIFKNPNVNTVVVYASTPTKKVIGEFVIDDIIFDDIDTLWEKTQDFAGINEDLYYQYFANSSKGYAIAIKQFKRYKNPLALFDNFKMLPPQSFAYLD